MANVSEIQQHLTVIKATGCWDEAREAIVLDSSFNPPTKAHQKMLEIALDGHNAVVVISLSLNNADKGSLNEEDVGRRSRWMKLLQSELPSDQSSLAVLLHTAPLFLQKEIALRLLLPNVKRITFIMGDDTAERMFNRYYYPDYNQQGLKSAFEGFLQRCVLLVFTRRFREGKLRDKLRIWTNQMINYEQVDKSVSIVTLQEDLIHVSSTIARNLLDTHPPNWRERLATLLPVSIYTEITK